MDKDWTGNAKSVYTCNGASNHSDNEREANDFYATEPLATELLLEVEHFAPTIWECACGAGHMSEVLKKNGYNVFSSDLYDRGYEGTVILDFFSVKELNPNVDIITNPPYKYAQRFAEHALDLLGERRKLALFLKLTFLESKSRKTLFEKYPPKTLYVSSSRLQCAKNGDFETYKKGTGTAVAYGWYVWEKGYKGEPVIRWIN